MTLIELVVVIAIIGILAALLLTSFARTKASAERTACVNNQKQMITAWSAFPVDTDGTLVANHRWQGKTEDDMPKPWVYGHGHPLAATMKNVDYLVDSSYAAFAQYIPNAKVYKCPGNEIQVDGVEAIRSYAMNNYMGAYEPIGTDTNFVHYQNIDDVLTPDQRFVTADINRAFICFTAMIVYMQADAWHHPPAFHHNGAGTFSFADGHVESKRWREGTTRRYDQDWHATYGHHIFFVSPKDTDLNWVQDRTTFEKKDSNRTP
jgi:prepilin-type N-terminal cleavage/methylation domain-containing protein/prepilin-type processing-associated H-X9-DG protein